MTGTDASIAAGARFTATEQERRGLSAQNLARTLFLGLTLLLLVPVVGILTVLIVEGAPAMSLSFLLDKPSELGAKGGIWPALVGTVWLTGVALLVSLPLGVAAAIYLSEYAKDNWLTRLINLAIVNLAGVPSIVHALFGVGAFVYFLDFGESILAAGCTLAVMTLPVVIVATRESLQAVPHSFREASWNMGATRWQTIRLLVLPNSISGILTGLILVVSRAVGETAPIMFTGAVFLRLVPAESVFDRTMALSYHLYTISTQVTGVPRAVPFAVALTLILVVLTMNALAIWFRMRLRQRKKW